MKKVLLFGFTGILIGSVNVFSQNTDVEVPKTSTAISIDGEIDAAWDAASWIEIDNWGDDNPEPGPLDFAAHFKLLWDDDYLYFLGVTTDDILMDSAAIADAGAPEWETDNWEIYWSPGNSHLDNMTELIQVRLAYANSTSNNPTANTVNGYSEGGFTIGDFVNAVLTDYEDGYLVEASLDLAVSATAAGLDELTLGDTIGFNAIASDNDGEAARENIGSPIDGSTWNQADTLLRLVLSEGVSAVNNPVTENIRIYPGVVTNQIHISGVKEISLVELINIQGQVVQKTENPSKVIDVSALRPGVYFVRIKTANEGIFTRKIVKK